MESIKIQYYAELDIRKNTYQTIICTEKEEKIGKISTKTSTPQGYH